MFLEQLESWSPVVSEVEQVEADRWRELKKGRMCDCEVAACGCKK